MKICIEISQAVDTIEHVMAETCRIIKGEHIRMSPDPTQPPIAPDPPVPDPPAPPAPPVSVDDALKGVIAMEATLNADEASVKNIQTAIDTATAPLAGAQATVANDINMYNTAVDVAIVALQKSKRVPSAPPINT